MTKANILRKYFKKFYDLDLTGMSLVEVLKQYLKAQYDFDSKGSGVVSIVQEMIDNELAPGDGGSGEGLPQNWVIVNMIEEEDDTFRLDKTWQEIADLYNSGYEIIICDKESLPLRVSSVDAGPVYGIYIQEIRIQFVASSNNDYPYLQNPEA